jgi:hypothetical protein
MQKNRVAVVGTYASIAVAVETAVFAFSLVLGLATRSMVGPVIGYIACIFLAVSVVALMCSVYLHAAAELRVFGLLGLAASILYAPFCMGNYFLQLSVVLTNPLNHPPEVLKLIGFVPGSTTFALDMLGYALLCLATLAAACTVADPRDRALRLLCFVHGALALPTIAAPILSGLFRGVGGQSSDTGSYVLLFWCALFIPLAILFQRMFRRGSQRT